MSTNTIAIVGAGPGLGIAIARRFGRDGYRVGLIARRRESVEALCEILSAEGIQAAGFIADVGDEPSLVQAFAGIRARFGSIDVLKFGPTPSPEGDPSTYTPIGLDRATIRRLTEVQLLGAVTSVQEVLPDMLARKAGTIFLTTSGSAHHVMPVYTPVGMVMSGLRSYALCLNMDMQRHGVYVTTPCISMLIRKGDPVSDPDVLAERYYQLHLSRDKAEDIVKVDEDLNALHDRDMRERGVDWARPASQS